ncbi:MAG: FAD-dependent oxidoreductase [Chloroflexi bacterium]|nr:FAD-dependent oxidoreductase [Chloroflexota bacterium]
MQSRSQRIDPLIDRRGNAVHLMLNGAEVVAYEGETVATMLLAVGRRTFRLASKSGEPRSLFCNMGVCYDCLVTVDGVRNVRACVTAVREGMRVEVGDQRSEVGGQRSEVGNRRSGHRSSTIEVELVVVGAGPAGMEAALVAAEAGVQVVLVDGNARPGGQYYRQPPPAFQISKADRRYGDASDLFQRLEHSAHLQVFSETLVWGAFPGDGGGWILALHGPIAPYRLHAQKLILATGAYDRPIAFPGWTLPGVLTAGAAQTLIKSQGIVPGQRFVLAGSGPLQLIVAAGLVEAGAEVVAVLEGSALSSSLNLNTIRAAWGQWPRMEEGRRAVLTLRRAGVPMRFGWAMTAARGLSEVEAVDVAKLSDGWHAQTDTVETLKADSLISGYGFLPNTALTRLLACQHELVQNRGGWVPVRDDRMQTTLPGVYAVGDGAGIGGASLARLEGRMAGIDVANQLHRLPRESMQSATNALRPALIREYRFAEMLGRLFTPGPGLYDLARGDTHICRCEEVSLGDIRQAQTLSCNTLNEIKGLTRAGMGNCQGRICGDLLSRSLLNSALPPAEYDMQLQEMGALNVRPPIHPLTVKELAESAA